MKRKSNKICYKRGRCMKITMIIALAFIIINCMTFVAFAAETNPLTAAGLGSGALEKAYKIFRIASFPVAAVGLTMCAFSFFMGSEKGFAAAKQRMLYIGIALMALMLIPNLMMTFATRASQSAWKPAGGNPVIIEPASPGFRLEGAAEPGGVTTPEP